MVQLIITSDVWRKWLMLSYIFLEYRIQLRIQDFPDGDRANLKGGTNL